MIFNEKVILTTGLTTGIIFNIGKKMFKIGDKVRVIGNTCNHDLPLGSEFMLLERRDAQIWYYKMVAGVFWYINERDIELITPCESISEDEKIMSNKFYRVKKDTHVLVAGAILTRDGSSTNYKAVDDIWNMEGSPELEKALEGWCEKQGVVENNPEWFERVYSVKSIKGMYYVAKDKMKELLAKGVVDGGEVGE